MTEPEKPAFTIDAEVLARAFDLPVEEFRRLMRAGEIANHVERGEGADAGRWRLVFRHGTRTCRLTMDDKGNILGQARFDVPG